jgi:proton glutamate symport protein
LKKLSLATQIFLALVLGVILGVSFQVSGSAATPTVVAIGTWLGKTFLLLLNMVVLPLVASSLLVSITGLAGQQGLGRLSGFTIGYYLLTSAVAISIGILVVNLVQPGVGMDFSVLVAGAEGVAPEKPVAGSLDLTRRMIPSNVVASASSNRSILAVIFFVVALAIGAIRSGEETAKRIHDTVEPFYTAILSLTDGILKLAPIGIFGAVLGVSASTGLEAFQSLLWYFLAVSLGLFLHGVVVLPLLLWFVGKRSPLQYAKQMSEALLTAFSTASSSGTLPLTMRCATERAKIDDRVSSFTLPLGSTVNMDGTALYEVVAVLFMAQMIAPLTFMEQMVVAFTALLASVGAAGIPHAGTVMMVIVLQAVGLPTEGVLIILSVDRVLDMARTTVNVWSDSVGAAVVSTLIGPSNT